MPIARLTDLSISKMTSANQTRFYDSGLPSFGIMVGKRRKTFFVLTGTPRKLHTLGKYPAVGLKQARAKALGLIDGTTASQAAQDPEARITEYERQLQATPKWKYEQKRLLTRHLLPNVTNLATTTKKDILAITDGLSETPSEQLHAHRAMKAFFRWCADRDYVTISPLQGLPMPCAQNSRSRLLQPSEVKALWPVSFNYRSYGLVIRTCLLLGTRKGEASAIQSNWIVDDTLVIPASATKNGQEHILPLSPTAKKTVAQLARAGSPNWNSWNKLKQVLDKETGLTDWTIHDTRRFFSTTLAQLKVAPHIIERLLNHRSGEISEVALIYNRYHYLPEMREALEKYEAYLVSFLPRL